MLVTILQGDPPQAGRAIPSDDPFGVVEAEPDAAVTRGEPPFPGAWDEEPIGAIAGGAPQLDPLKVLCAGSPPVVPEPARVNPQPDSPLRDALVAPALRAVLAATADAGAIPRNWDQPADVIASSAPAGIPGNWDRSVCPPPPRRRAVADSSRVQPAMRLVTPRPQASRAPPSRAAGSRTVVSPATEAPATPAANNSSG